MSRSGDGRFGKSATARPSIPKHPQQSRHEPCQQSRRHRPIPRLAGQAVDSLQQSAVNRAARTRNSAGFGEIADELARQKGIAEGNQAAQNQLAFSNTAFQPQMAALQGLSGLFGVDATLLGRTLGIPAQLLNVRANASRPSGFFS